MNGTRSGSWSVPNACIVLVIFKWNNGKISSLKQLLRTTEMVEWSGVSIAMNMILQRHFVCRIFFLLAFIWMILLECTYRIAFILYFHFTKKNVLNICFTFAPVRLSVSFPFGSTLKQSNHQSIFEESLAQAFENRFFIYISQNIRKWFVCKISRFVIDLVHSCIENCSFVLEVRLQW